MKYAVSFAAITAAFLMPSQASTPVSFTGTDYTQNFDTLPSTGTNPIVSAPKTTTPIVDVPTSASGVSLTGWTFSNYAGTGANSLFDQDTGSSTTGATYSYGSTASTDRALGSLSSGGTISDFGLTLVNNTGSTLTSFTLSYTGEEWRYGGSTAVPNTLSFAYALGATDLNNGAYINSTNLNFVSPVNTGAAAGGALDGNAVANQTAINYTISSLLWSPGTSLTLRWSDANDTGNDDGLAIDNLTLSAISTPVDTLVWNAPGGTWDTTSANWTGSSSVYQNGDIVQFTDANVGVVNIDAGGVSPALVQVENTSGTYTFQGGALSGGGSLVKTGAGDFVVSSAIGLSGGVDVEGGTLKTTASDLLSDTASLTIGAGGSVDLQGNFDTVGSLVLNGGSITSGPAGLLTLNGNVSVGANAQTAFIAGNLSTGTASHTVSVADGAAAIDLEIDASLASGSRLVFNGTGTTALTGDNSGFSGGVTISSGKLIINSATSLGTGSFFFNGGTLTSSTPLIGANTVTTFVSIGGPVTIDASANALEFADVSNNFGSASSVTTVLGQVAFDGPLANGTSTAGFLNKGGTGTLTLNGVSTYTGATTIQAGTLLISATGALNGTTTLSISSGATLQLQNALSLNNDIHLTLVTGSTLDLDFSGTETIGTLVVNGGIVAPGTYTLAQLQTMGGATYIGNSEASLLVTAVPEPGTVAMFALGLGVVLFSLRRRCV